MIAILGKKTYLYVICSDCILVLISSNGDITVIAMAKKSINIDALIKKLNSMYFNRILWEHNSIMEFSWTTVRVSPA